MRAIFVMLLLGLAIHSAFAGLGGKSTSNIVNNIVTTSTGFAVIKDDGSVHVFQESSTSAEFFGNPPQSSVTDSTDPNFVPSKYIVAGNRAYAVVREDGSVVAWGQDDYGGDTSSVAAQVSSGVVSIAATESAFAALKDDGSVVAWGINSKGGDTTNSATTEVDVTSDLSSGVVSIAGTDGAFFALKDDGSVVVWGAIAQDGDDNANAKDTFKLVHVNPADGCTMDDCNSITEDNCNSITVNALTGDVDVCGLAISNANLQGIKTAASTADLTAECAPKP